jgi:hypothetical protein
MIYCIGSRVAVLNRKVSILESGTKFKRLFKCSFDGFELVFFLSQQVGFLFRPKKAIILFYCM